MSDFFLSKFRSLFHTSNGTILPANLQKCRVYATLAVLSIEKPNVEALRLTLQFEDIASRLAKGDSPRKVARELNQRPDELKTLIKTDEFLAVLTSFDRDLADDIRAEREAGEPAEYEKLILAEAAKSVTTLADIRDSGESENSQVNASKAIIDIAEKIKKLHGDKAKTNRVSFPDRQLKSLVEAAREVKEMRSRVAEQSPGTEPVR